MTEEIKDLHELITNVRLDIRELNTKMDGIKDLTKKVEEIQLISNKAAESIKSFHHRLDDQEVKTRELDKHFDTEVTTLNTKVDIEVQKITTNLENKLKETNTKIDNEVQKIITTRDNDNKELKQSKRWMVGTVITVCGILITLVLRVVGI